MICLKDTIKLVTTSQNGYGDSTAQVISEIDCLFEQSTGYAHSGNVDIVNSDAFAYVDPDNQTLIENGYRIEGMYVIANPFGINQDESWYKITRVSVNQKKLTDNNIDNVQIFLKKTEAINGL